MIYYIRRTCDGLVKIGTTDNLSKRMYQIRRELEVSEGIVTELVLLGWHPGSFNEETESHQRFKALHVYREWFSPQSDLMQWITQNCCTIHPKRFESAIYHQLRKIQRLENQVKDLEEENYLLKKQKELLVDKNLNHMANTEYHKKRADKAQEWLKDKPEL